MTITAYDAYGNIATGYTGTVSLTSSKRIRRAGERIVHRLRRGQARAFFATLDTSGTQSITATDTASSSITGTDSGIAVQAAAAKTLTVTGFPTSDTAGTTGTMTITAYDAYGNVATGYPERNGGSDEHRPSRRGPVECDVQRRRRGQAEL